jgi:branched-chain amino acid aminotransferase
MSNWVYLEGKFVRFEDASVSIANRSFNYGDGLFESIRIIQGHAIFFYEHCERLFSGMQICGFEIKGLNAFQLLEIARELILKNEVKSGKLKINVYRKSGGRYTPDNDGALLLMSLEALENAEYTWNSKGLQTGLYTAITKPVNLLSGLKTNAALLYVMASREARIQGWDEIFLLNDSGNLCEGSSTSLFLVDENRAVHTPALSQGPLWGVMRKNIIRILHDAGIECIEREITPEELLNAREVFVTSAIRGIHWVVSYREKRYFNTIGKKVFQMLQDEVRNQLLI